MESIDFSDSKFNHLRCKYDADDFHIFKDPVSLPCGNEFCVGCVKKFINDKKKCKCDATHDGLDVEKLEIIEAKKNEINEKATEITEEIINKLLTFAETMRGTHEDREQKITALCQKVREEINQRVVEIKAHLDVLHQELKAQLRDIKGKVFEELEKLNMDVEKKTTEYKAYAENMEKMLEKFDENKDKLQKDIYTCQDHIEELKRLDDNFHKILRKVSFEPSDWSPDASYIGTFTCPELMESDEEDEEDQSEDME